QDIREIAGIAHEAGALFHTDAVQAAGHIPLNVRESGADLLSISSHKLHGPKGIGALYVRRGVKITPVSFGGGQEKGLRSGTLNVPAIVGFGKACEIARESMEQTVSDMARMREYFIDGLKKSVEGVHINGIDKSNDGTHINGSSEAVDGIHSNDANTLPSIVSVSFEGIEGSSLLIELDMRGICCSTGSACSASKEGPSHVLLTAGLSEERIRGAMRFSFSKYTTYEELDHTVKAVGECVERLRRIRNI
nr:aminotransferase class V-fold PLP-dependent enzyme [Lachnospiraceae bacterium]